MADMYRLLRHDGGRGRVIWTLAIVSSLLLHAALFWHGAPVTVRSSDGMAVRQSGATRLSFRVAAQRQPKPPAPKAAPQPPRQIRPVPRPAERAEKRVARPPAKETMPTPQPTAVPTDSGGDSQIAEQARHNYLGALLAHIEEHKFYPRSAQRRGLQGVIQVSFQLHQDGRISGLSVVDGPETLRRAAADAVDAALPLPPPPPQVRCPLTVSYGMEFRLH